MKNKIWALAAVALGVFSSANSVHAESNAGWKKASNPTDVVNFLNGTTPYGHRVLNPKISLRMENGKPMYYVRYSRMIDKSSGRHIPTWGWKKSHSPTDVKNFLSGKSVRGLCIVARKTGSGSQFIVFYQNGTSKSATSWGFKKATSYRDARAFMAGSGIYDRPARSAFCFVSAKEMYVFYQ